MIFIIYWSISILIDQHFVNFFVSRHMGTLIMEQRKRIHPHKFTLWVAIASIVMMFAGFTSAYIVKRNQANWFTFEIPIILWYSTAVIIASSFTLWLAEKKFKRREMAVYRQLLTVTFLLGILFGQIFSRRFADLKRKIIYADYLLLKQ